MDLNQKNEASFLQLIDTVCSRRPRQISEKALADFAKQVWYGELDLVPLLREHLVQVGVVDESRRRLLYVVDRLTCYPCMLRSKAAQLRELLKEWAELRLAQPTPYASELASRHLLDKKAFEWGLEEDITPQMKLVLKYQTRHYAASLGRVTGYSEP
ncbi:hypothetical protein EXW72_21975 [Pseudomonas sp. BCA14]|uniref:hypothetical protein n=1 Tax=unclassified Pseudomonas TaxID=196821 RepID=UPI00106E5D2D|nr:MULTISPECIES: hypothetical protein [unclassified Pseudomonas]TFF03281.1 hypothetical protein EXW70_24045 [Pseudomonas sp. JMN1]TFF05263.1 hypothetical protein EXW71_24735 [Pseudomonas sp. BCA17]TFF20929.1 hypothetical protein EXW72_21975 [Pseudomonas sp. BCA14]TFF21254.1 hypothetical protein EXW73_22275 [Pseudomonas sp. BCA13]